VHQTPEAIKERVKILSAKRAAKRAAVSERTIEGFPLEILEEILMKLHGHDMRQVIASSFAFLRVAAGPCPCDAFNENNNFIGIIIQPRYGYPSVLIPDRIQYDPLDSVGKMLQKFIALSSKAGRWFKIIDSRGSHLLVSKDASVNRLGIVRPLQTMIIDILSPVHLEAQERFVSAALVPAERPAFDVLMMSRVGNHIVLRKYSSRTSLWSKRNIECPLALSTLPEARTSPLYASNSLFLLDPPRMTLVQLNIADNTLGTFLRILLV
jgi:hypothetical protein